MKVKSTSRDLYVADIPFETEEEELHKLFALCGTVRSIHMITDAKSGVFKGCAFVHMATAAQAKEAINTLDGLALNKRVISVTEALPRKTTTPAVKDVKEKSGRPRKTAGPGTKVEEKSTRPKKTAGPGTKVATEKPKSSRSAPKRRR